MGDTDQAALRKLITDFEQSGGSEMANAQLFLERFTRALGIEQPSPAREDTRHNDYVFERNVTFRHPNGTTSTGRIDCYKRDSFIWEAKQSAKRAKSRESEQLELAGVEAPQKLGHAKRGTRSWDRVMIAAKKQAEDYARALPDDHSYPPFILVADIGNVIEVYADFSGQGRNYAHFPDRQSYRLSMADLLEEDVQQRLRTIWTDPHSLDPARISAEVTEDIAQRLAKIAKSLERRYDPKDIAEFLMRCLFTMFAEDVGLIEETEEEKRTGVGPFEAMLERMITTPDYFPRALESLWAAMDNGDWSGDIGRPLKRFNGSLFKTRTALKLEADDIRELWLAAKRDWRDVEPAIFGTLLERALAAKERGKLGAHFTPRVYVERLVVPTIIEPLREDWAEVQQLAEDLARQGKRDAAVGAVRAFHHQLCTTRVLDPACGTGNFLYVSLELMKRLEGEVLDALESLGDDEARLLLDGETVNPRQFYGLEINPRAVPIADLVLWIGFLKWQLRTTEAKNLPEPILHAYGTIKHQDALLAYESMEMLRDKDGKPLSRWDGETMKLHPITGEEIPDPDAKMELYEYVNPRRADWPEVEFIVGNPPFIGNKRMKRRLGAEYVEALRKTYAAIPDSVDFVMYWWGISAEKMRQAGPLRRFGLVTTASISQKFNRALMARYIGAEKKPLSVRFSIPNHPWVDDENAAAVRVAFLTVSRGQQAGLLEVVSAERDVIDGMPVIEYSTKTGTISPGLRIGAQVTSSAVLLSNEEMAFQGIIPVGTGFRIEPSRRGGFPDEERALLKPYKIGSDLLQAHVPKLIISVSHLSEDQLKDRYPALYQHLLLAVKPHRDTNDDPKFREEWWRWGRRRDDMFDALCDLDRYLVTCRTASHRIFSFEKSDLVPDAKIIAISSELGAKLTLVSSRLHLLWSEDWARLGKGNDTNYNHSECFGTFPFPVLTDAQSTKLDQLGERLDAFRKDRLAEHTFLTMTNMYNVLERLRELEQGVGEPFNQKERDIHEAGLISALKDIHDDIDREVFAAYGWDDLGERLVGRAGATTPSPHKSEDQEAAEEELLTRLVALNQERAAEEKRGLVRWLRPEYQKPRLAHKVKGQDDLDIELVEAGVVEERAWPAEEREQFATMRDVLVEAEAPLPAEALAALFKGRNTPKRKQRIARVLEIMADMGGARRGEDGYFLPR